jgi:hypothetical protein
MYFNISAYHLKQCGMNAFFKNLKNDMHYYIYLLQLHQINLTEQ